MSPRVGIVVLNWNGGEQTIACMESLRAQRYPHKFVVLVDSNSQPAERARLRQRYGGDPEVECCWLPDNRGYAGGNNAGIAAALAHGAELVVIATQDVTFAAGALEAMVAATADPRVGIVGPKVVDVRHPQRVLSLGERVRVPLLCVPRSLLRHRLDRRVPYAVTGVLGCVLLLTRRCLQEVGGFDEDFFAYYEEVDLCLRARASGFLILCAPDALVTHDGMRGFLGGFTQISAELKARNLLRLMRRWAAPADWLTLAPTYGLLLAGSGMLYALRGRGDVIAALMRGVAAGVRGRSGPPESLAAGAPRRGTVPDTRSSQNTSPPV
jgi:GT2 family glycosyltransferase